MAKLEAFFQRIYAGYYCLLPSTARKPELFAWACCNIAVLLYAMSVIAVIVSAVSRRWPGAEEYHLWLVIAFAFLMAYFSNSNSENTYFGIGYSRSSGLGGTADRLAAVAFLLCSWACLMLTYVTLYAY